MKLSTHESMLLTRSIVGKHHGLENPTPKSVASIYPFMAVVSTLTRLLIK